MAFLMTSAIISLVFISYVIHRTQSTCFTSRANVALKGHVILSFKTAALDECWRTCEEHGRCQSLNFFGLDHLCEINNRTIELASKYSVKTPYTAYFDNPYRVPVGTVRELPALSCTEVSKSVGGVSGRYWLIDHARSSMPFMAYCNMTTLAIEGCAVGQCKHGGTCTYFGLGKYHCACPRHTSGNNCEILTGCINAQPLGMNSGAIRDAQITASSIYSTSYQPWFARLGRTTNGWCPRTQNTVEWIQVDLSSVKNITAVATKGRSSSEYPKKYSISYSSNGVQFTQYEGGKEFAGNVDSTSIVRNEFVPKIKARFIRLTIPALNWWPTMHMELYGCN